jgi:hypothetical protein
LIIPIRKKTYLTIKKWTMSWLCRSFTFFPMRKVTFPYLSHQVEMVRSIYPKTFSKMSNKKIRQKIFDLCYFWDYSWSDFSPSHLSLNSIYKAKQLCLEKQETLNYELSLGKSYRDIDFVGIEENKKKAEHHDRIPSFIRLFFK